MLKTIDEKGHRRRRFWDFNRKKEGKKGIARMVRRVVKQLVSISLAKGQHDE